MSGPLPTVTIVASLVLALWYLVRALRDRAPGRTDLAAAVGLAVLVVVLVAVAVVGLVTGERPAEAPVFVGYLITTVCFTPTAFVLARMEPTRWGNVILGVACLVLPVLVLRLEQLSAVHGG